MTNKPETSEPQMLELDSKKMQSAGYRAVEMIVVPLGISGLSRLLENS